MESELLLNKYGNRPFRGQRPRRMVMTLIQVAALEMISRRLKEALEREGKDVTWYATLGAAFREDSYGIQKQLF